MGFDNECILDIQNLAGEYFCPVCRMLVYPNEALQSQCTHLYCKHCLTYIVATTRACPYDGYLVTQEDSKPLLESNKTLAETIGKIAVHCLYHRSGCTWQGPLSDCPSHCSACAFGNSPVVCNRCAIQIVHRQVQEHAQSCPGVQSRALTAEGALSSAAPTSTNQMQATVQGGTASSQAAVPVTDLSHQQQHYQQYAGYDPYQQHYQHYYQQHYQQQLVQHPPLHPQSQVQPLLPPLSQPQVQTLSQQQPPSLVHTQPPAQLVPLAQHYPQSQAISAGHQQQPHPRVRPQSHSHLQSHTLAQPSLSNQPQLHPHAPQHSQLHPQQVLLPQFQQSHPQALAQPQPQPHIHLQAQPSVQLQQNSQVHAQAYPPQANYINHYPPISHTTGDHSYPLQSQSGITQQPSVHSYPQGGFQQQQQRPVQVQNQIFQQLTNPTQLQAVNQQKGSVISSPSQHVSTVQQQNVAHEQPVHMLHHHPPVQAVGQHLAPQYPQQQVLVTTRTPMHPQLRSNVPPPMPRQSHDTTQPRQSLAFPHSELPHQSLNQIGRASVQLQTYPVTNEVVNQKELALCGLRQQSGTWIRSDNHPQSAAEQQSGFLQPLVGSQSEPNYMSAENSAARGCLESRKTTLVEDKPSEVLLAVGASENGTQSDVKGVREEKVNDSAECISVGKSGSVVSDPKEGDADKVTSKGIDSQNIQPANKTDEISLNVSTSLPPISNKYEIKASVEGLPSDVRPPSTNLGMPFRRVTGIQSEAENSLVPRFVTHSAPSNHVPPLVSQGGASYPTALDSDVQMMVNPSSYVFEGRSNIPTGLIAYSRGSFDGRQPYLHHSGSGSEANLTPASLKAGPDSFHASGWRDERFRGLRDKMLLEQGSQRMIQEDLSQFPRPPDMKSEHFRKQGEFFSSMPYERDSFGFSMIPRPLDKALYGLHHDEHFQPGAFPEDKRLHLHRDFRNAASMYGRHFGLHHGSPDREHPNMSSHTIRYGSGIDFRMGTDGGDHNLLAPVKPLNLSSDSAELSFISSTSSNLLPHVHQGSLRSFSGKARIAELSGHGSIPPPLSEMGYRSNFLLTENRFYKGDLELSDNSRKRKVATMVWCRICKVDCETVEGLDLHSQTREHQRMSMDMVLKIKQQNSKRQKMTSNDFDPLPRKQSSQDYRI